MQIPLYTLLALLLLASCSVHPPSESVPQDVRKMLTELKARSLANSPYISQQKTSPRKRKEAFDCIEVEGGIDIEKIPKLDISFIEADIAEALLELSMLTQVPIIIDETVQGLVTITLVDSPMETSLKAILAPGNYAFKRLPGFIFVGSQYKDSPSLALLSDTCRFQPQNLEAAKLIELLSPGHRAFITSNVENNLISITAPPSTLHQIQDVLLLMDRPRDQVLLEVSIVEVSREASSILGVNWGNLNLMELSLELAVLDRVLGQGSKGQNNYNYPTASNINSVGMERFKNSIGILKNSGYADIKAMPSIITLDGKEANFSSTETIWLPSVATAGSNQAKGLEYGVRLRIIPHVGRDQNIRLEILQASVSDLTTSAQGDPLLISHSISSTVEVASGDVLVLGGLLQERRREGDAKVPLLSRIPGIRHAFSQQQREFRETEVLIVIHPKVVI